MPHIESETDIVRREVQNLWRRTPPPPPPPPGTPLHSIPLPTQVHARLLKHIEAKSQIAFRFSQMTEMPLGQRKLSGVATAAGVVWPRHLLAQTPTLMSR